MAFTRFTSGRTGNLTFSLLNEIMDRIEALEQPSARVGLGSLVNQPPFLAKVGTLKSGTFNEWSFTEHTYPESRAIGNAVPVAGGRTSQRESDQWGYPLIGTGFNTNDILMVFPLYDDKSRLVFHPMQGGGNGGRMARVITNTVATANQRWNYTLQPVKLSNTNPITYASDGGQFLAYNGAENVLDAAPTYGVGAKLPPGTYIRQPIRNDVIVLATQDGNGFWNFCVPNGYEVTCP